VQNGRRSPLGPPATKGECRKIRKKKNRDLLVAKKKGKAELPPEKKNRAVGGKV